jgi:hypothetical protein
MAVKGLAVAAAVATTGTAAVEIKHVAKPETRATHAQTAQPRSSRAASVALRAAARAAAASRAVLPVVAATRTGNRLRTSKAATRSSAPSRAGAGSHGDTQALLPPAPAVGRLPAPTVATPHSTSPAALPAAPAAAPKPVETAVEKLDRLRKLVQQAFTDAQGVAADGTQESLALATGLLDQTLGPLRTSIDRVLATVGLRLPSPTAPAPAPSAPQTTTTNVLAPVQQVLDGVQSLLQKLLGRL